MTDFKSQSTSKFPESASLRTAPKCYNYAVEFAEAENANGKVVIKNISAPEGVEASVTFQVNEFDSKLYKGNVLKSEVTNPLAKGKSLYINLTKTNSETNTQGVTTTSAPTIYLCYKAENRDWNEEEFWTAFNELAGLLFNKDGSSRVRAMMKKVLVPKGC